MPATRKKTVVQTEDLNQLQSLFGKSTTSDSNAETTVAEETQRTQTVATPAFEDTNKASSVLKSAKPLADKITELDPTSNVITEEKKEVSDTTVGIRMTTSKKREMKAYFIQHGTTMSQGVIDAFTLLKMLEDEGKVEYKDGILERV